MKNTLIAFIIAFLLYGCTNKKAQAKAMLDDVIKVHDKVMAADERLEKNKMQLDTLLKQDKTTRKDTLKLLINKLVLADSAMENWMHKFDYEQTGKSPDESIVYMGDQKKQIMAIDSQISAAVAQSNKYLLKIKRK
ncbi:MAG TPA: hypothetical protein DCO83_10340 [Mucilaginibacter sp.]|jgi:hypothetical protein|nr:hypothetical protein [Mucilaginibacter sp.]